MASKPAQRQPDNQEIGATESQARSPTHVRHAERKVTQPKSVTLGQIGPIDHN